MQVPGGKHQVGQGHGAVGDRDGGRRRAGPGVRAAIAHPAGHGLLPPPLRLPPAPSAPPRQAGQGGMEEECSHGGVEHL